MNRKERPFWERKKLNQMNQQEWESLCDGCAQCCLHKLEDEDTGDIYFTNVVCELLDLDTCRCTNYPMRSKLVPTCLQLTPDLVDQLVWLPETCAYRRLAEGKKLPGWHPLITGNPETVVKAGASVKGKVISAREIDINKLEDFIV